MSERKRYAAHRAAGAGCAILAPMMLSLIDCSSASNRAAQPFLLLCIDAPHTRCISEWPNE